ncbi:MAG: hypothetical protein U0L76_01035 [Ruminococcus sp.]|nr:hypothetical protein [Ruminococcus sp.]
MKDKNKIINNINKCHSASSSSRYRQTGLNHQKVKLSSKNFDKMMKQRGLSDSQIKELKASTAKGSKMQVRHAKAGEKFVTTHGTQNSSGVFVSEKSLGKTPCSRINKGALPHSNSAKYETKVELSKDQNLVYSKIGPQSKFSKMDPKQAPRKGGGQQVITDGGYKSGAINNRDTKYPVPAKNAYMKKAEEYKKQHSLRKSSNNKSNIQSNNKGQLST